MHALKYDALNPPDLLLWGHNLNDYIKMFHLAPEILTSKKIIEIGLGAGTFNLELTQLGGKIISYHPLYQLEKNALESLISKSFTCLVEKFLQRKNDFNWESVKNFDLWKNNREENIKAFFKDYAQGKQQKRYIPLESTNFSYDHFEFDYALCSHYFFSYNLDKSVEFHFEMLKNLCYIAKEVRIFPLLSSDGQLPELLGPLMHKLQNALIGLEILAVPYELQKQGNALLRLWSQSCDVKKL